MIMNTYDSTLPYPRDLVGYGRNPPHAQWPGNARIAVQFVLNYEEGGESAVMHGDAGSEQFLSELFNPASYPERHLSMEGIYEYGSRAGERPLGWYTGRDSPRTRRLVADYGGFEYDSDYYGDDLPFWMKVRKTDGTVVPQLIVPYTLDCNDMRFALPQGYSHADPFYQYMKDSFDALYAEGDPDGEDRPKMLSIGMHCRMLGRPGRIVALQRFLDHIAKHDRVWVCRRIDIARHWKKIHPYQG